MMHDFPAGLVRCKIWHADAAYGPRGWPVGNRLDRQEVIVWTAESDRGTERDHAVLLSIRQRVEVAIQAPSSIAFAGLRISTG